MEVKTSSSASHAWKSITKGRDVIRKGGIWRSADRKSISFWGDNWVPVKYRPKIVSPIQNMDIGIKVCQFMDQENGVWKEELLDQCLLDFEAAEVRKMALCRTQQCDILTWPFNADGKYTVKSGYQSLLAKIHRQQPGPSSSDSLKPLWQAIWQLKVPDKVKSLVWRACQNSLPTKMNLVKRRLIMDDKCDQHEDVHSALYLCPKLAEL